MAKKGTDNSGYMTFKKDLAAGEPGRLYLLWGEEDYLREHYLGRLRTLILSDGMEEFNHKSFQGKDLDLAELEAARDALPVFSARTLVEVRDYDPYKAGEGEREKLAQLIEDIPDYCCLVFVLTDPEFKPDSRMKLHAAFKKYGTVVQFAGQEQSDLINWIGRRFAALGKKIDRADAEYLIFQCGSLMTTLASEIEKVGAFAAGEKIRREEIDAVVSPVLDAVVFSMTDAVSEADFDRAAGILDELLRMREAPIKLLALLGWQLRRLFLARVFLEENRGGEEMAQALGTNSDYVLRRLNSSARRFSLVRLSQALRLCLEADYEMKSSGGDGEDILKLLFVRLAAGCC